TAATESGPMTCKRELELAAAGMRLSTSPDRRDFLQTAQPFVRSHQRYAVELRGCGDQPVRRIAVCERVRLGQHRDLRRDRQHMHLSRGENVFEKLARIHGRIEAPA